MCYSPLVDYGMAKNCTLFHHSVRVAEAKLHRAPGDLRSISEKKVLLATYNYN